MMVVWRSSDTRNGASSLVIVNQGFLPDNIWSQILQLPEYALDELLVSRVINGQRLGLDDDHFAGTLGEAEALFQQFVGLFGVRVVCECELGAYRVSEERSSQGD